MKSSSGGRYEAVMAFAAEAYMMGLSTELNLSSCGVGGIGKSWHLDGLGRP